MSGRAGANTQSTRVGPWPEAARNVRSVVAGNVNASPGYELLSALAAGKAA